jgi:hypothetical protein
MYSQIMQTEPQKSIYFFPRLEAFLFKSPPFTLPFQPSCFMFNNFCFEEDVKICEYGQIPQKSGLIVDWNIYYILQY